MKFTKVIIVGIPVLALVLIALVANSSDVSTQNKIRVAYFPNIGHAIPIVGIERGIFQQSLPQNIQIETRLFDSGPQVVESIFADSIDIAYVGPGPAINAFLKSEDHDVKILSGAASGGASFVVHPNSKINSVADFGGKRIAAPQIGNTQDVSLRNYLSENGLTLAEKGGSVVVLNVPNPDIYTLFTKGEIDAAWVPEPWASIFVLELDGKRLFTEEELWDDKKFASVVLIGRETYVKENPEIIQRWLESHREVVEWINENPVETRIIFSQFMKDAMGRSLSDSVIDESLAHLQITSDPMMSSIVTFAKRADNLGYLGRDGYNLDGIWLEVNSNAKEQEG
ncbi:MAG: ABC transporter substrate-binding protein [Nitrosarchaeum sp.]|nr:ABC transporter substrate-binding protein [Nitrosarchaeum sp.]